MKGDYSHECANLPESSQIMSTLAANRRARHDYAIHDTFDAGMVLTGAEVKSVKAGMVSLKGSYVGIRGGEAWLLGATISPYPQAGKNPDYDPHRSRKLLLTKSELGQIAGALSRERLTAVPLEVYTRHGLVKIKIGLARSKKQYEKRETIKKRDIEREVRRTIQ